MKTTHTLTVTAVDTDVPAYAAEAVVRRIARMVGARYDRVDHLTWELSHVNSAKLETAARFFDVATVSMKVAQYKIESAPEGEEERDSWDEYLEQADYEYEREIDRDDYQPGRGI